MWPRVVEIMLGAWLVIGPFVFRDTPDVHRYTMSMVLSGALIAMASTLAFWSPAAGARYITLLTLILFVVGGYYVVKGAINLGRQDNYEPDQPIFYSHKVHAGNNQISCLYCHGGAFEGKHANIPSVNTCMNCHMTISEYSGEQLFDNKGEEVNGTAEIQKLYEYAGWDPSTRTFTGKARPVEWVKIHSLPDHVYFNHSQHTVAGQVQCQTCHGEVH